MPRGRQQQHRLLPPEATRSSSSPATPCRRWSSSWEARGGPRLRPPPPLPQPRKAKDQTTRGRTRSSRPSPAPAGPCPPLPRPPRRAGEKRAPSRRGSPPWSPKPPPAPSPPRFPARGGSLPGTPSPQKSSRTPSTTPPGRRGSHPRPRPSPSPRGPSSWCGFRGTRPAASSSSSRPPGTPRTRTPTRSGEDPEATATRKSWPRRRGGSGKARAGTTGKRSSRPSRAPRGAPVPAPGRRLPPLPRSPPVGTLTKGSSRSPPAAPWPPPRLPLFIRCSGKPPAREGRGRGEEIVGLDRCRRRGHRRGARRRGPARRRLCGLEEEQGRGERWF